jgi:hypothetical protein
VSRSPRFNSYHTPHTTHYSVLPPPSPICFFPLRARDSHTPTRIATPLTPSHPQTHHLPLSLGFLVYGGKLYRRLTSHPTALQGHSRRIAILIKAVIAVSCVNFVVRILEGIGECTVSQRTWACTCCDKQVSRCDSASVALRYTTSLRLHCTVLEYRACYIVYSWTAACHYTELDLYVWRSS